MIIINSYFESESLSRLLFLLVVTANYWQERSCCETYVNRVSFYCWRRRREDSKWSSGELDDDYDYASFHHSSSYLSFHIFRARTQLRWKLEGGEEKSQELFSCPFRNRETFLRIVLTDSRLSLLETLCSPLISLPPVHIIIISSWCASVCVTHLKVNYGKTKSKLWCWLKFFSLLWLFVPLIYVAVYTHEYCMLMMTIIQVCCISRWKMSGKRIWGLVPQMIMMTDKKRRIGRNV